jgi:zinc transport system ATP-binding protein
MEAILDVKNLSVSFGDHIALNNVSFELGRAEALAVIGPNGSGKTVLLKSLLGLQPYHGKISWDTDARLAYVPQKIDADRHLPISLQNLLEAKADIQKLSSHDIRSVTKQLGLTADLLKTPVGHLSGGQFQKAQLAFALLGNPNVLLFDEPTASLDELSEEHIYELLEVLRRERGMTIILVSHDLSIIPKVANRVLCLNKNMVCYGTPREVLTTETFATLFPSEHRFYKHASSHGEKTDSLKHVHDSAHHHHD